MRIASESDVVLADPPSPPANQYATAFPNLGNLYLISYLRQRFPGIRTIYLGAYLSEQEHLARVIALQPRYYGISFSSPFARASFQLINQIKSACPRTLIICGGAHPSADPHGVLAHSRADLCCIGEGEETFSELVAHGGTPQRFAKIRGVAFRDANGALQLSAPRPFFPDLDSLPFPAWDACDLSKYEGCRRSKASPTMAMVASRGCPFNCTFCSNPVWRPQQPRLRTRSPGNIAQEAEALYQLGIREIYIRSDEMNVDPEWGRAVFQELGKLAHPDLFFQCNLRASPITPDLAVAMREARCWLCHVGIEACSDRVLKGIRKGVTSAQITRGLHLLKQQGISVYAFMMLYQAWEDERGLQLESSREVLESLLHIWSLASQGLVTYMSWAFATPYPGSELYRVCQKYRLFRNPSYEPPLSTCEVTTRLPGIPRWKMALARSGGLLLQSALQARRFGSPRNSALLKHALSKFKYMIRPW